MLTMIHVDFALAWCLYYKIWVNTVVLIGAASVQGKPYVEKSLILAAIWAMLHIMIVSEGKKKQMFQ